MSLKDPFPEQLPDEVARLVEPLLPVDSVYRLVVECVDEFLGDEQFAGLYAQEGRPGINPVILSLVTIFQFLEKLPDRAAAHMAVMLAHLPACLPDPATWRDLQSRAAAIASPLPQPSLTAREEDALNVLKTNRRASTQAVATTLYVDRTWAWRLLASLRRKGYVRRVGGRNGGGWVVA